MTTNNETKPRGITDADFAVAVGACARGGVSELMAILPGGDVMLRRAHDAVADAVMYARVDAESRVAELERERDDLRLALRSCISALHNGSVISENASHEFHCGAPLEIAAWRSNIDRERDDLKRRVGELESERDSARASLAAAEERVREATRAWLNAGHDRDSARAALAKAETVVEHARWAADYLTRGDGMGLAMPLERLITSVRALDALPPQPEQPAAPRIVDTGPRAPAIRSTTPRQPSVPGDVVAKATGAEKDPRYRTLEHRLLDKTTAAWVLLQVAAAWEESGVEPFGQELRERSVRIARESGSMPEQPAAPEPQPDPAFGVADEPHGPTLAAALEMVAEMERGRFSHAAASWLEARAAKVRGGVEGGDRE